MAAGVEIWRGFDLATLEREYSPSSCVADLGKLLEDYATRSKASEARATVHKELAYGSHPDEVLDYFPADNPRAPLQVYIHGGYWQQLSKNESTFAGADFVSEGVAFAAIGYTLAPAAGIDEIIEQCRRSLVWLHRNADELGFDPKRIFISGSSAGAHLAAMLLLTRWDEYGVPQSLVKGATLMSGVYDLRPVCHTYINEPLNLDEPTARNLSPLFRDLAGLSPAIVSWGEYETDEFKRQSQSFADALRQAGSPETTLEVAGCNHFDIVHAQADRSTPLGERVFAQLFANANRSGDVGL